MEMHHHARHNHHTCHNYQSKNKRRRCNKTADDCDLIGGALADDADDDEEDDDSEMGTNDTRRRGKYRCRKCGEAKRAHDCPFACKQKSVATQTSLEVTGGMTTTAAVTTKLYASFHYNPAQRWADYY